MIVPGLIDVLGRQIDAEVKRSLVLQIDRSWAAGYQGAGQRP
jgi:hypothetical protein